MIYHKLWNTSKFLQNLQVLWQYSQILHFQVNSFFKYWANTCEHWAGEYTLSMIVSSTFVELEKTYFLIGVISFLCLHRSVFHLCLPNNLQKEFLHGLQISIPDQLMISFGDTFVEHTLQIMMVIDMDIPYKIREWDSFWNIGEVDSCTQCREIKL